MQTDELFTSAARATFHYHGVPISLDMLQMDAGTLEAIEKRIDRLLQRDGWAAPQQATTAPASNGNGKPSQPKPIVVEFDGDNTPICPIHDTRMKQGRYGWYCTSKAEPGQPANDRGYCTATHKD